MMTDDASALVSRPDLAYGVVDGRPLLLDLLHPDPLPPKPMPAIIFIMGGAWMEANRKVNFTPFLAAAGFCTVSIDHRLSHEAIFPAQIHDAKAAVRWLRANATQYHVDPDRIGVWGISSGAHLAALLGTSAGVVELEGASGPPGYSSAVQAVAAISPPTDFARMGRDPADAYNAEALLVGGPLGARAEVVRAASPLTYVRPGLPPFLIVHGEQDEVVPISQAELLVAALQRVGTEVTYVPLPGEGHMLSEVYETQVQPLILSFFTRHLQH